ncbi:hypothetical protein GFY24_38505 [Nocardia sp. SYP-A9097]|uniref:hypothetical protein n=1 Tax=Nocardia sp. SYP-A9097 TaxID=2663237 RepID=UPI00129BA40E|nr:hypothetical protein [Nocardia sp. SYP-A9097]MRH93246.1 hypothetical protein [Nocardia sp. SYP-A9097]
MKKLGSAMFIGAAVAGIVATGAGMAAAEVPVTTAAPVVAVGEPDPTGTGSASQLPALLQTLTGSFGKTTPADPAK